MVLVNDVFTCAAMTEKDYRMDCFSMTVSFIPGQLKPPHTITLPPPETAHSQYQQIFLHMPILTYIIYRS